MSDGNVVIEKERLRGRFWLAFAAGVLWGVSLSFVFAVIFLRNSLINEYQSQLGFEETLMQLQGEIKSFPGWMARSSSCSLPKPEDGSSVASLKLCNGEYASEIMNDETSRKVAAMMPCNFAVYQKSDGKTYISCLNMRLLGSLLGGRTGVVFSAEVAPDQEQILNDFVK